MKRLVVCVLLASCGGGDGANGTIDLDNLGMELAVVGCERQWDCCTDVEITEQYMGITIDGEAITTEEKCVEFSNALLTGFLTAQFKDSLAKGRIDYDGAAAADCVAAMEAVSCDQYNNDASLVAGGCDRPFVTAKVANGGGCTEDYECTSNNCVGESTSLGEPSVDGACMPIPNEGESCDDNCAGDLICDFDQATSMDICQPMRTNGAPCNIDSQCASDHCESGTRVCATKPATCDGR